MTRHPQLTDFARGPWGLALAWVVATFTLRGTQAWGQGQSTMGLDAVYGSEGADVLMTDAARFHVTLHSQGAGFGFQRGTFKGAFLERGWQGEFVFVRHPKEEKTRNPVYEESLPYVYGKVNAHHALRLERYTTKVLTEKFRQQGVTVARTRQFGAVLGLAKPVFLEIGYPDIPYDYTATERYDPSAHFSDNIYGRADWSNGLDELTFVPGVHASYGLDFEYGDERFMTKALTTGVSVDAFLVAPEVFAEKFEQNNRLFVTLFATFEVGRNWTR